MKIFKPIKELGHSVRVDPIYFHGGLYLFTVRPSLCIVQQFPASMRPVRSPVFDRASTIAHMHEIGAIFETLWCLKMRRSK
jgi:hypothetical protein